MIGNKKLLRVACICVFILFVVPALAGEEIEPARQTTEAKPVDKAPDKKDEEKGSMSKKGFRVTFYGHLRLDASRDDSRTNNGNKAMWTLQRKWDDVDRRDDEMNFTPRHTRIGLFFDAPETDGVKPSGRVEFDFYNATRPEDNPGLRLRHAFGKFTWGSEWSLLFGHTSDVIGPLVGKTLNTCVMWNTGNLGFHRTQLRLTRKQMLGKKSPNSLVFETAACRAYTGKDYDGGENEDGEDAGVPDGQYRIAFERKVKFEGKKKALVPKLTFGLWGHHGKREVDLAPPDRKWTYGAKSFGSDISIPFCRTVAFQGEVWTGAALGGTYRGGIAQDVNTDMSRRRRIRSRGYFGQIGVKLTDHLTLWTGYGRDNPINGHLKVNNRSMNESGFLNLRFNVTKTGWIGIEYQRINTWYFEDHPGGGTRHRMYDDNRVQMTFCIKF